MQNLSDKKLLDLEAMLEKRRDVKRAAFLPGTDGDTPAENIYGIVAARFGEDRARAMKNFCAPGSKPAPR